MKKITLLLLLFSLYNHLQAQPFDGLVPLKYNAQLLDKYSPGKEVSALRRASKTKVIFEFDTVKLPFIDDFSKKGTIRDYTYNITDPGVKRKIDINFLVGLDTILPVFKASKDTTYTYSFNGTAWDSVPKPQVTIKFYLDENDWNLVTGTDKYWPHTDSSIVGGVLAVTDTIPPDTIFTNKADTTYIIPDGKGSIWKSPSGYVNEHYPVFPPTLGVVTFDGLDSLGRPYDATSPNTYGEADVFGSHPIFLKKKPGGGKYTNSDSVYFSFFVQKQGLGDQPEVEDSLILEFYSPTLKSWRSQWSSDKIKDNNFHQVMIKISDTNYFQDGFQVRFKNYASLSGNFDHWHVDYVKLDANRSIGDTIYDDVTMVYESPSLLKEYSQMSWVHFKSDPGKYMKSGASDTLKQKIRNLSNINKFVNYEMKVFDKGTEIHSKAKGFNPNFPAGGVLDKEYKMEGFVYPTAAGASDKRYAFKVASILSTTPDVNKKNDTVFYYQNFGTYYSYDDNSAEQAYFVQGAKAKIAVKYEIGVKDTLKAINIHIPRTKDDIQNNTFRIKVWKSLSPEVVIHQSSLENPVYSNGVGFAYRYALKKEVLVDGVFYVGIEQSKDPVYIGFDKNFNTRSKNFYSIGGKWFNASYSGSLMIHPEFGDTYMPFPVSVEENAAQQKEYTIYPNPARNTIAVKGVLDMEIALLQIYDLQGKLINEIQGYNNEQVDVAALTPGIYLLRLTTENGEQIFTDKFIIPR